MDDTIEMMTTKNKCKSIKYLELEIDDHETPHKPTLTKHYELQQQQPNKNKNKKHANIYVVLLIITTRQKHWRTTDLINLIPPILSYLT